MLDKMRQTAGNNSKQFQIDKLIIVTGGEINDAAALAALIEAKAEPISDKPEETSLPDEIVVNDDYIELLLEEAAQAKKTSKQVLL